MDRLYIDKYTGKLERTDLYRVKLTLKDGRVFENLEPRRLFPTTNRDMYFTLLDENERETAFVRDLREIDDDSREALLACFQEYYMIPQITRLVSVDEKFGALKWTVETDRGGPITFRIRSRHSDIKNLYGTNRVLVRDTNDNRYEIDDYTKLDAHSLRLLFAFL